MAKEKTVHKVTKVHYCRGAAIFRFLPHETDHSLTEELSLEFTEEPAFLAEIPQRLKGDSRLVVSIVTMDEMKAHHVAGPGLFVRRGDKPAAPTDGRRSEGKVTKLPAALFKPRQAAAAETEAEEA